MITMYSILHLSHHHAVLPRKVLYSIIYQEKVPGSTKKFACESCVLKSCPKRASYWDKYPGKVFKIKGAQ